MNNDRKQISTRLDSLFDKDKTQDDTSTTMKKRLSVPSSRPSYFSAPSSPLSRTPVLEDDSQQSLPILRWFSTRKSSPSGSPSGSRSASPSSALNEALNDDFKLPSRPEAAVLPSNFHPPRNSMRPPPLLNTLTRSTLPTSSISPPVQSSGRSPDRASNYTVDSAHPVVLNHSPPSIPTRSSLDTLRSIHSRVTPPPQRTPQHQQSRSMSLSSPILSWFSSQAPEDTKHESILDEEDQAEDSDQERENIRHKYMSTKNPIVFCHGLLGFDSVMIGPSIAPIEVTHWRGIKEVLESNGTEVLVTRVPATSSPIDRAKVLADRISEVYPGRNVHLIGTSGLMTSLEVLIALTQADHIIGHSMGGLDCRYLTTHLTQRNFKVLSVTTIATPHRGSAFADYFLATIGQARMPQVLSLLDLLPNGGGDGKAFEFLTTENMKNFNVDTPDVDGVQYFSYGATYDPGLIDTWRFPHSVILEKEGPNDGLVSIMSSQWGTYLGTLENVSHLDLVGWINTARYKWAEIMGREIKFKPATFYLGVADYLAKNVEGLKPGDRGDQGKDQVEEGKEPDPAAS